MIKHVTMTNRGGMHMALWVVGYRFLRIFNELYDMVLVIIFVVLLSHGLRLLQIRSTDFWMKNDPCDERE